MTFRLPKSTRVLAVQKSKIQRNGMPYDAVLEERAIPQLKPGEILVKMGAVSFNHRELWIRLGKYPGISPGSVLGADGAGTVIASSDAKDPLIHQRVFLTPMRGWESHPDAPESRFGVVGGVSFPAIGTFAEHVVVERDQVLVSPAHLDDVHLAAWPVAGLTAWRAAVVNARVSPGDIVLVTGIGGGVALTALQICLARGAQVYVTSGSAAKLTRAAALGAQGGVLYTDPDWPAQLASLLGGRTLSAVIDSAGGDIMGQTARMLKPGGCVVCYGMTASPAIQFRMPEVMRQQRLIGSTMGSHQDMRDATAFLAEHRIVPVVGTVLNGLAAAEEGFDLLRHGGQFGKIVLNLESTASRL